MNIFYLDEDPVKAAHMLCDQHVVKMCLESAQILSTVLRSHTNRFNHQIYKPTHMHHPCVLWAGESQANYVWLYRHYMAICQEFVTRYGHQHKSAQLFPYLEFVPGIGKIWKTESAQAMPEQYRIPGNPVQAYRNYYIGEKSKFARWRYCDVPEWYTDALLPEYVAYMKRIGEKL